MNVTFQKIGSNPSLTSLRCSS